MKHFISKHRIVVAIMGIFLILGGSSLALYNLYFSETARTQTFKTVKSDIDSLTQELANATPAKKWLMHGAGGSLDNPVPCGYVMNGFTQQFDCVYVAESDFTVTNETALRTALDSTTQTINGSGTQAFALPKPETKATIPDLSSEPDSADSPYDDHESAVVSHDIDYRRNPLVHCYMTMRYNARQTRTLSDATTQQEYIIRIGLHCLAS